MRELLRQLMIGRIGWRWVLIGCLLICSRGEVRAQRGGHGVFTFLDAPISPRVAGIGGKVASIGDLNTSGAGAYNPALISPAMRGQAEASFALYYAGIQYSNVAYFHQLPWGHMMGVSTRQMWYGKFTRRDGFGNEQGSFSAYDFTLSLHYAMPCGDYFTLGASLTPIYSQLEQYNAFGLVLDVGFQYTSEDGLFTASIVAKKIGGTLKPYSRGRREWAPFELIAGLSYTLEHAPLRFIFTLQNLESWNNRFLRADSYTDHLANLSETQQEITVGDRIGAELLAHPIVAVELIPLRYFFLQLGYNPVRGQQMGLKGYPFIEGLSYGFGVNVRRFGLHFSRAHYHRAGATNHIAVYWRFGSWLPEGMLLPNPRVHFEEMEK